MLIKEDRRRSKISSRMPAVLALAFTLIYGLALTALMFFEMPGGNKEALLIMFGSISTMLGHAAAHYYGTTQASKQKDQIISDMVASDKLKQDE